jgi:hypothetical protein
MNPMRLSRFLLACTLAFGLNVVSLYTVRDTMARFSDTEYASGNVFESGELDVSLSETFFDGLVGDEIEANNFFTTISATTSGAIEYGLRYEYQDGALCDQLGINVSGGGAAYTGLLSGLSIASSTELGLWEFSVGLAGAGMEAGSSCAFDLVYEARLATTPGGGYVDEERLHVTITYTEGSVLGIAAETPLLLEKIKVEEDIPPQSKKDTDTPPELPSESDQGTHEAKLARTEEETPHPPGPKKDPVLAKENDEASAETVVADPIAPEDPPADSEPEDVVFVPITEAPPISEPGEPVIEF